MGCGGLDALLIAGEDAIEDVGDGGEETRDGSDEDIGSKDGVVEDEDRGVREEGEGGEGGGGEVEVDEKEENEGKVNDRTMPDAERTMTMARVLSCRRTCTLSSPIMVHHPSIHKDDSTHLVSLTSTTYGSLKTLDNPNPPLSASSTSATAIISTWDLMDGLNDLSSPTTPSSTAKKPYFLPRSLTYHQEALLSSTTAPVTIRKRAMIPCNLGGSTKG